MNFNDLQAFVAAAETTSFSEAAAQLHLTQPAVSKRIANLEEAYATKLFDRVGRRVILTQAGDRLLPHARTLLQIAQDTQRELQDLSTTVSGSLRITTSHHIGLHRLAPVLRTFRKQFPDVALNLSFEDSEIAHQQVRRAETELAIVTLDPNSPQTPDNTGLSSKVIWHDPLQFMSDKQPNAKLQLAQLAQEPCVLPGLATYTGRIVQERFNSEGLHLSPVMSTNYLETIGMLVSVGLGWSVLPATMQGELSILEVDTPPLSRQLGYVLNPQRMLSRPAAAFLEVLDEFSDPDN